VLSTKGSAIAHGCLVALILIVYLYLGVYRAMPYNLSLKENQARAGGASGGSMRVYKAARAMSKYPLRDLHRYLIYREHNPAVFLFVMVVLIKAGVNSMFGLEMVGLALSALSLLLLYLLVLKLFRDRWIALFTVAYVGLCPPFVRSHFLHAMPYARFFSLSALLAFLYYLRTSRRWLLVLAVVCYFLTCWNYWMWYVSTALLLAGIHYVERERLISRDLGILVVAPISAFASFLALLAVSKGGLLKASQWLFSVATWRSVDVMQSGGYTGSAHKWEAGDLVNLATLGTYLQTLSTRIEDWYYLSPAVLAAMLAVVLFVHHKNKDNVYKVFFFLVPAAFSWHLLMIQHTIQHHQTTGYHYPLIALIFGCFVAETPRYIYRKLEGRPFRKTLAVLAICPILLPVLTGMTADILPTQKKYMAINRHYLSLRAQGLRMSSREKNAFVQQFEKEMKSIRRSTQSEPNDKTAQ